MELSQILHSPLPILNWKWWQILVFVFVCDWLVIRLLQLMDFHRNRFELWKSALYGDLFLPFGVASSVCMAQRFKDSNAWYASIWWNLLVLAMGVSVHIYIRYFLLYKKLKKTNPEKQVALSTNWHSVILVLLFYIVSITIIPAATVHQPTRLLVLMIVGYGGWAATFFYDILYPKDIVRRKVDIR